MLCYAMLCYAMLCYAMLCYAMLCYAMLCYAMLCYVMLCYVMLCYVVIKRWNALEEKRIQQEVELETYLTRLVIEDKERYFYYFLFCDLIKIKFGSGLILHVYL